MKTQLLALTLPLSAQTDKPAPSQEMKELARMAGQLEGGQKGGVDARKNP